MFPRGFVGAAAYWNYNASIDSQSADFVASLWDLNDRIIAVGGASCPTKCVRQIGMVGGTVFFFFTSAPPQRPLLTRPTATTTRTPPSLSLQHCDQLTACGVPYIPPPPPPAPAAGSPLGLQACEFAANQQFAQLASGALQLTSNPALCVRDPGAGLYPLTLGACDGAATFAYNSTTQWLVVGGTGDCLDVEASDQKVGSWACGSPVQPNQAWALGASGTIVSQLYSTCVTSM